jgi:hypothetical protein
MDLKGFAAALRDRSHTGKLHHVLGSAEAVSARPESRLQAGSKDWPRRRETGEDEGVGVLGKQLADFRFPLVQGGD